MPRGDRPMSTFGACGLEDMSRELRAIDRWVLLVPGNNAAADGLRRAGRRPAGRDGAARRADCRRGRAVLGLGGGIPETP